MGMLLRRYHNVSNQTVDETTDTGKENQTVDETTEGKGLVNDVRENSESDSADNE